MALKLGAKIADKLLGLADKGVEIIDQKVEDKDKVNELAANLQEIRANLLLGGNKGQSITKVTICFLITLVVGVLAYTFLFAPENMDHAIKFSTSSSPIIGVLIGVYGTAKTVQKKNGRK